MRNDTPGGRPNQGNRCSRCKLYEKDIIDGKYLVFYFLLYVYYYNARKRKQPEPKSPGQKGVTIMKAVKKIEALLSAYYETFKH